MADLRNMTEANSYGYSVGGDDLPDLPDMSELTFTQPSKPAQQPQQQGPLYDSTRNKWWIGGREVDGADETALAESAQQVGTSNALPPPGAWERVDEATFSSVIGSITNPTTGRLMSRNFGIGVDNLQRTAGSALRFAGAETLGKSIVDQQDADLSKTSVYSRNVEGIGDDNRTVTGWFLANLAQQGPNIVESVVTAALGAAVGGPAGAGAALLAMSGKAGFKQGLATIAKKRLAGEALTATEHKLLREAAGITAAGVDTLAAKGAIGAARGAQMTAHSANVLKMGKRASGAALATGANNLRRGVGELYGESIEGGEPDRLMAALGALPYAGLESASEFLLAGRIFGGFGRQFKKITKAPSKGKAALRASGRVAGGVAAGGAAEGLTELGQEGLNIAINPMVDWDSPEGISRLMNGFAAGAAIGGPIGGVANLKGREKPVSLLHPYTDPEDDTVAIDPLQIEDQRPPIPPPPLRIEDQRVEIPVQENQLEGPALQGQIGQQAPLQGLPPPTDFFAGDQSQGVAPGMNAGAIPNIQGVQNELNGNPGDPNYTRPPVSPFAEQPGVVNQPVSHSLPLDLQQQHPGAVGQLEDISALMPVDVPVANEPLFNEQRTAAQNLRKSANKAAPKKAAAAKKPTAKKAAKPTAKKAAAKEASKKPETTEEFKVGEASYDVGKEGKSYTLLTDDGFVPLTYKSKGKTKRVTTKVGVVPAIKRYLASLKTAKSSAAADGPSAKQAARNTGKQGKSTSPASPTPKIVKDTDVKNEIDKEVDGDTFFIGQLKAGNEAYVVRNADDNFERLTLKGLPVTDEAKVEPALKALSAKLKAEEAKTTNPKAPAKPSPSSKTKTRLQKGVQASETFDGPAPRKVDINRAKAEQAGKTYKEPPKVNPIVSGPGEFLRATDGKPVKPMARFAVYVRAKLLASKFAIKPKITVVESIADLKARHPKLYAEANAARKDGSFDTTPAIAYAYGDKVIVFSEYVADEKALAFALAHETLGHIGLRAMLGAKQTARLLKDVYESDTRLQTAIRSFKEGTGITSNAEATEEWLANYAARLDTSMMARIWNVIAKALAKVGIRIDDVSPLARELVSQMRRFANGEGTYFNSETLEKNMRDLAKQNYDGRFLASPLEEQDFAGRTASSFGHNNPTFPIFGTIIENFGKKELPKAVTKAFSNKRFSINELFQQAVDTVQTLNYQATKNEGTAKVFELFTLQGQKVKTTLNRYEHLTKYSAERGLAVDRQEQDGTTDTERS